MSEDIDKISDAMCEAAIRAEENESRYIQGFSYTSRHVIRDVTAPPGQQEIWSGPVGGSLEHQAFQRQCRIERMRRVLAAVLSFQEENA